MEEQKTSVRYSPDRAIMPRNGRSFMSPLRFATRSWWRRGAGHSIKGGGDRPAGLRRGQEGHRPQAPHHGRYARPDGRDHGALCRGARPRWRGRVVAPDPPRFPVHRGDLRRCRLPGPRSWQTPSPGPAGGVWRSSNATMCRVSRSSPNAGSSSAPWPGSATTAASPVISSATPAPLPHLFVSP